MDVGNLLSTGGSLWSPLTFAALISLATGLVWLAFAPSRSPKGVQERLEGFLERPDITEEDELNAPFAGRVVMPVLRRFLRILGAIAPKRNVETTREMLLQAGEPGGLTVLDFFGLRLLFVVLMGGGYYLLLAGGLPSATALRNALLAGALGFFVPLFWLRSRARRRMHEIQRALPDALDMLTIGVEAGLAFESALLRVGEKWHNALTHEFRRAVSEMQVGTSRNDALRRMAERSGVADVTTFVTVLIQSSQLGVSITQVLHSQAAQMRMRRRQRAEELARQASIKMVFPLVFLIFPAMFVVILGPAVPTTMTWMNRLSGGG